MSVKCQWHINGVPAFFFYQDNEWCLTNVYRLIVDPSINWLSNDYQPTINRDVNHHINYCINPYINPTVPIAHMIWSSYQESFDDNQELAESHREMIVRCSSYSVVSQHKLNKLYFGISQAQRKDHNWHKTICFRRNSSFFWIWCTQSSQVPMSNNKDTPKQTIWVSLCQKRVKFCFLLSPSLTHSLSHFHDIVASPPKGTVAIKRERFPHSPILYHYFLYSRIVCMMKYGAAALKSCRYLTWKGKKKERDVRNASLNFRTFLCVTLRHKLSIHVSCISLVRILMY